MPDDDWLHPHGEIAKSSAVALRLLIFCATLLLCSCAGTPLPSNPTKPVSVSVTPYTIATLDEITLHFQDGTTTVHTVQQDGSIDLDGTFFQARGKSPEALESALRKHSPRISDLSVREFRTNRVTVLGEVFHQIHTDLGEGPMRVMDAIASANGFTPIANKRRVRLLRQNAGQSSVYEFDLRRMMRGEEPAANFLLEPGDVITVPRNFL